LFVPVEIIETGPKKELEMARKRHTPEQVVNLLRQVEFEVARGKLLTQARWLKELEQENAKLKRLMSELSLEKLVLSRFFVTVRLVSVNEFPTALGDAIKIEMKET
jgi:putative transposase